jgi:predicted DNA-binding transcriptional regulator AlpA
LPPEQLPAFVSRLGREDSAAARAVEFGILTLARHAELAGTQWSDLSESMWRIPGQLRRCGDPRVVPLSRRAIEILRGLPRHGEFVFARDTEHPLRSTSLLQILRRVNDADRGRWIDSFGRPVVFAGFRRTFCEWATEIAHFPLVLAEIALGMRDSHSLIREGNLNRQREVFEAWAEFCCGAAGSCADEASAGLDVQRLAAMLDHVPPGSLIRAKQVAVMLSVTFARLWREVQTGTFPRPLKITERLSAWRVEDIRQWMIENGLLLECPDAARTPGTHPITIEK